MPQDSNNNAPNSEKTSAPAAAPLTETQFLARQTTDAKAAIARSLKDLEHELLATADPRAWMKVHPWATLGAAAIAGFAAAAAAVPSPEEQALKRIAKLEAALNGNGHGHDDRDNRDRDDRKPDSEPSLLAKLAGMALHAAQPVLASAIAGIAASFTAKDEAASENPQAPKTDPDI
jgi:hypothetical protein